ncbi:PA14 domain-containing protein [Nonomuraea typhae]|uniref:PA14 domain-containing protein n=1 Tax=Nonomuraea typhae TaxID=2603600 RepID=UPI0012FCE142|nr:PA14 domain-containing protein [Nonomuraea typhae]
MITRLPLILAVLLSFVWLPSSPAAAQAERHGLKGDYHLSTGPGRFDFGELKATVVEPNIEFADLNPALSELTGRDENVTVRWTGRVAVPASATYTFSMIGDNGFRLWVDNRLVIDNWRDIWDVEQVGTPIALEAGRKYDVKIEYFEHYGGANLRLRWQSPELAKTVVPTEAFYLPEGFDPPGPVAAEIRKSGDIATLTFAKELKPVTSPTGLKLTTGGSAWPIKSATAAGATLTLTLGEKIPLKAGNSVRASYDGTGGIAFADGTPLGAFPRAVVLNRSEYLLASKFVKDVNPAGPHPEYPRPQLVRDRWQGLNGPWQFAAAKAGEQPPIGKDLAERIIVPFPVESALSGIGRTEDRMWYRRTFEVPRTWRGERVILHLDAVDWEATVYVNGTRLATHRGGYDRFSVDVTDALKRNGRQELIVGVFDPTDKGNYPTGKQRLVPGNIWYTPTSGIWQSVWMEPAAPNRILAVDSVPDLSGQRLKVTVDTPLAGTRVDLVARDGSRIVGRVSGRSGAELSLPIRNPKLWSPDTPFLYDLTVTTRDDRVKSYFGMREISLGQAGGKTRMLLNGKPVFQLGTLDQGYWPDGIYTAPTDAALRYDLEVTKQAGFNAVRKHVKVESDRWYYHADKLGLLVWQDMPSTSGNTNQSQFEAEFRRIVDQHRSSPSIVMWVPFNESWGQYEVARVADMVKSWDPSRLVDNQSGVNCCGAQDGGNGDVIDWHMYPGPAPVSPPSATRASVLGEYGGLGLLVLGHTYSGGGWGYRVEPDAETLTSRYVEMDQTLRRLHACEGLSAAIYTQTTDVEVELNGLMTYDRAVIKPDLARVRAANRALIDEISPAC